MLKIKSVKINKSEIDKRVLNSKAYSNEALKMITQKILAAQKRLINDFEQHPITREIEAGPTAENMSNTLSGYGNLFSFIGFNLGSNPLEELRAFLSKRIKINVNKRFKALEFTVRAPDRREVETRTRMPFETANSWARMLEAGMSGFSFYMFKKSRASRSGKGIQIDNEIRPASSAPTPYMSKLLKDFRRRLL